MTEFAITWKFTDKSSLACWDKKQILGI